jgi:hypothetical protein
MEESSKRFGEGSKVVDKVQRPSTKFDRGLKTIKDDRRCSRRFVVEA